MKLKNANLFVMANHENLLKHIQHQLEWEFSLGSVNLKKIRSLISSPRLFSIYVKAFSHPALFPAGDTYLDKYTMLAAPAQSTFSIPIGIFQQINHSIEAVQSYHFSDTTVMHLQIWPFDARDLNDFQQAVAVALSYTPAELIADSRISLALDELVSTWGFFTDDF